MGTKIGNGNAVTLSRGQVPWFHRGQYADANFYADFVNNRYAVNGAEVTAAALWSVTQSVGGYAKQSDGSLISYAANTLRIGGDGVLIEEAKTNLALYCDDFSNAAWSKTNATIVSDSETTPDSSADGDTLSDDSSTGTGAVHASQAITFATSTDYTVSIFAKADGLSWVRLAIEGMAAQDLEQYYNLSAGSVGTPGGSVGSSGIEQFSNGWYRCWFTFTSDSSDTSASIRVQLATGDGATTVDLDGTSSVFVWGAQVEAEGNAGAFVSSLIITAGSTVTRPTDNVQVNVALSTFLSDTHGTLLVGCYRYPESLLLNGRIIGFSSAEGIDINNDNATSDVYFGNPTTLGATATGQLYDDDGGAKLAFSWDADVHQRQLVIADGVLTWDRIGDVGFSGSDMWIGTRGGAQNILDGYVSELIFWPYAKVWDDLETLTRANPITPDYYLSSSGSDANDGTSIDQAKLTPGAALALISNGEVLGVVAGSEFDDELDFDTLTDCIGIKVGGGNNPLFRAREIITDTWVATEGYDGVYQIEWSTAWPGGSEGDSYVSVWFGTGSEIEFLDPVGIEATSLSNLESLDDGFFMDRTTWDSSGTNTLYVRLEDGENPNTSSKLLSATKRFYCVNMGTNGRAIGLTGDGAGTDDGAIIAARSTRCHSYNTTTHGIIGRPDDTRFEAVMFYNRQYNNRSRPGAIYSGGQGATDLVFFAGNPLTDMYAHAVGCFLSNDKSIPGLFVEGGTGANIFGHTGVGINWNEFIIQDCESDSRHALAFSGAAVNFTVARSNIQLTKECFSAEGSAATYVRIVKNFGYGDTSVFDLDKFIKLTLDASATVKIKGNVILCIDTSGGEVWNSDGVASDTIEIDYNTFVRLSGTENVLHIRNQADGDVSAQYNVFDGGQWALYDDAGGSQMFSDYNTYNNVKIVHEGVEYDDLAEFTAFYNSQSPAPSQLRDVNSNEGDIDWVTDPSTWTGIEDAVSNTGSKPKDISSGAEHYVSAWD